MNHLACFVVGASLCAVGKADDHSWVLGPFERLEHENPVLVTQQGSTFNCPLQRRPIRWEAKDVFNPAAVVRNDQVHLLYRAEDHDGNLAGTSRVGLALSEDGISFPSSGRRPVPVLYPDTDGYKDLEWQGGIEDPRVVESPEGMYVMTYTAYNGVARLFVATSHDLLTWEKRGPAFSAAHGGAFADAWTKSGSIVCRVVNERLVAAKINGKFWMYWGENSIYVAASEDLVSWTPLLTDHGPEYRGRPDQPSSTLKGLRPQILISPRRGSFDSSLVEPGPPAVLTSEGIVFIYNSKNRWCMSGRDGRCDNGENDPTVPPGTYSAGQVRSSQSSSRLPSLSTSQARHHPTHVDTFVGLFSCALVCPPSNTSQARHRLPQVLLDATDPTKVLARTSKSFMKPKMK